MAALNLTHWVEPTFCDQVRGVGKLSSSKGANVPRLTVNSNHRRERISGFCDPKKSSLAGLSGAHAILHILSVSHASEIDKPVVSPVTIYMVDVTGRPDAVNVEPSKPVCKAVAVHNVYDDVAFRVLAAENFPRRGVGRRYEPCEQPRFRVVTHNFSKGVCGKICLSHAVVPYKQWFGQKPRRVTSTSGLRYFNRYPPLCGLNLSHAAEQALRDAATSHSACINRATAIRVVLDQCGAAYQELGTVADRHANDAKTLIEAWPLGGS